ncbi:hypothetical protein [Vibrio parahaemolyticus]|uniref:hypothetical protein n=2 Tax=Vibrio parahaemolyticus TaxID=670 RepID=UPI0015F6EE3A|nr:hypothetical protein [Vibrio parahaemolyticus]MBA5917228.1 hypothetical protein [Vibrio parahaemolyticus]
MDMLINDYGRILQELRINAFNLDEDKYSGVFLPMPFDEYWSSNIKIMLVGRETAGWNTDNHKNTIKRVADFSEHNKIDDLVHEAIGRYRKHLSVNKNGNITTKTKSRFKQYFFRLSRELKLAPKSIVYANIFAWDYNKKTPRTRPKNEVNEITSISKQLLAAQIGYLKPDIIIFAAGFVGIDSIIKQLFNEKFGGYPRIQLRSATLANIKRPTPLL